MLARAVFALVGLFTCYGLGRSFRVQVCWQSHTRVRSEEAGDSGQRRATVQRVYPRLSQNKSKVARTSSTFNERRERDLPSLASPKTDWPRRR